MSHCMVTLTANAGISLVLGQKVIWIDALHSHRVPASRPSLRSFGRSFNAIRRSRRRI